MNENAKTKLVLEYTGMDDFSCPVYKDQFGKLWKDIDLGKEPFRFLICGKTIP